MSRLANDIASPVGSTKVGSIALGAPGMNANLWD